MKAQFLLALIISIFVFQCSNEKNQNTSDNSSTTIAENISASFVKQEIAPPISNVDVAFHSFKIKHSEAQILTLDNGTSIEIPANAFVDAQGNPATNVAVNYREFHDAAAILASGIPMKASMNGEVGDMQTAGMFEINAMNGEEKLSLAEGKEVTVNMASNVGGNDYDFWAYDEATGNWDNKGQSTPQPNTQKIEAQKALDKMVVKTEPAPPVKFDKTKPVLNFDINVENFPELNEMKNIFWQYTGKGENPKNAKWIYSEAWETADIVKGKQANEYTLVLKNDRKNFSTSVCPSQTAKDFDAALAKYSEQMADYKKNAMSIDEKKDFMARQTEFVRSFKINDMGIFNYDILVKDKENVFLVADFNFGESVPKSHSKVNVYLITNDSRSVVAFPYSDRKKFGFNPEMDNQLIAILPNNKYATFSQEDFDENLQDLKAASGDTYTFKMRVHDEPIKDVGDLRNAVAAL